VAFLLPHNSLLLYHHNMTTLDPITWTPSTAKVGDLLPKGWKRNPRYSTASTASALAAQLAEFGQYYEVLLDGNGIIDGHQRVAAWAKAHGRDFVVTVKTAERNLTEAEREIFTLRNHAGAMGAWNFEELGNWDIDTLAIGGFGEEMLASLGQQQQFLMELLGKESQPLPTENEWGEAFDSLPDGERAPFQQMTFTLHDDQAESVKEAMQLAKSFGGFDSENENSNGNALYLIVATWAGQRI
jgi:hypothetical protein